MYLFLIYSIKTGLYLVTVKFFLVLHRKLLEFNKRVEHPREREVNEKERKGNAVYSAAPS